VVLGTLSVVAVVFVALGLQSAVESGSDATTTPAPTAASPATPSAEATVRPTPEVAATPSLSPSATGAPDLASPAPGTSSLDVLNQTVTEGLAGRAAVAVEQRGWQVERIDNATLGTPATTVYVPVGLEAVGAAFVRDFPEVTRTRPAFEGLAVDRLTLVLAEPDALTVVAAMEATDETAPSLAPPEASPMS
jgi:hypothetical protein